MALVKPQFEAGPEQVGKGGIIRDPEVHRQVLLDVIRKALECGYSYRGLTYSPVTGADGNLEFFLWLAVDQDRAERDFEEDVEAVVDLAHSELLDRRSKST